MLDFWNNNLYNIKCKVARELLPTRKVVENMKKKRVLKKWVEKVLSFILGIWFTWITTTIDTIDQPFNEIKGYLVFTTILTILALLSFYLLGKYTNLFEEE